MTWGNTWYNAPCADWPVEPLNPVRVSNRGLPPALLFQATDDAATPYEGGVTLHRKLKGSSLVVEEGGGNHGVTLSGNACLDRYLADYLAKGTVPRGKGGDVDAVCARTPDPKPHGRQVRAPGLAYGRERRHAARTARLPGLTEGRCRGSQACARMAG